MTTNELDKIKNSLTGDNLTEALPELNRLLQEDTDEEIIEAVLDELVILATVGQQDCAVQAQELLTGKYRSVAERRKTDIINGILACTEKHLDDPAVFFLGFNFALKLKWKELFIQYIERYNEQLKNEFDDDYIEWFKISKYLQQ